MPQKHVDENKLWNRKNIHVKIKKKFLQGFAI